MAFLLGHPVQARIARRPFFRYNHLWVGGLVASQSFYEEMVVEQTLLLLVFIVGMGGFMFWNQWRSRRRYQQKIERLQVGDQVVTIGGIHGKLTDIDREADRAHLEVAPGVQIQISLGAVGHQVGPVEEGR